MFGGGRVRFDERCGCGGGYALFLRAVGEGGWLSSRPGVRGGVRAYPASDGGGSLTYCRRRVPRVLSIAGSDSGGGAGIQADLKAFARCGVHGMTAITAVTWQNTVDVRGVTMIPPEAIIGQVR